MTATTSNEIAVRIFQITAGTLAGFFLYFGVLQCELGASLLVIHQTPGLLPRIYLYWLTVLAMPALLYAVSFNWVMAVCESRYLESILGEEYRRYCAEVPFFVPWIRSKKER